MRKRLANKDSIFPTLNVIKDFDDFLNGFINLKEDTGDLNLKVDISEDEDAYYVEADLPGVKKEDVGVELKENHLIISAERKQENEEKKKNYYTIEKSYGKFYRAIPMPADIEPEDIQAKLDEGVLKLTIKKSEKEVESTKKIEIL